MKSNSRKISITIMAGIAIMTNAACTTIKPVYDTAQTPFAAQIEPEDRIRLTYLDGRVTEIRVTEVTDKEIKGGLHKASKRQPRGAEVIADWRDVDTIENVKISPLKTAGAAVGIIIAMPFLALGAVMAGAGS
jgi:hypothetical protein